jgi:hypothetical protein
MAGKDIYEQRWWFTDPIPDWILEDAAKFETVLQTAADYHAKAVDLQIQELQLEKARVQAMVNVTKRAPAQIGKVARGK